MDKTSDDVLRCPACNKFANFHGYSGSCCGLTYKLSFGWVTIHPPYGKHEKKWGRGWDSLRKISLEDIRKWVIELNKDSKPKVVRLLIKDDKD